MTDEELEKEAEERANKFIEINFNEPDNYGSEKEVGHFSYYTGYLAGAETREKRIEEQLTKAKELKQLLQDIVISSGSDREEFLKEAEQFLKEVDK